MPSFFIETFGCQMNVADSDMLADLLAVRGYSPSPDAASADLVVVNTCSVREHAEKRARARITQYAQSKAKSARPQSLWVVGCMAERLGDSLKEQLPGVDRVIGATAVEHLSHDLDSYLESVVPDTSVHTGAAPGVSTFLPIMRGCNNYCSYCVVPYVRGREHSIPAGELVHKAADLAARGVREITLLGQNVNSYHDGEVDFAALLQRVHDIEPLARIRFTTSHPKDCSDALIRAVADLPKLCKHIHLPVQSGSTTVLARMNRKYTREDYLHLVGRIREAIPDVDITTDVMVGFPGETENDFRQTMSLFEQVRFTTAFMFAYSAREETAAAQMSGQVAEAVKKQRLEELISLQTSITKAEYESPVGRTAEVFFTVRQVRRDKAWMGQDNGCKRVLLHCNDSLAGTILPVRIVQSTGMTLIAERISL